MKNYKPSIKDTFFGGMICLAFGIVDLLITYALYNAVIIYFPTLNGSIILQLVSFAIGSISTFVIYFAIIVAIARALPFILRKRKSDEKS